MKKLIILLILATTSLQVLAKEKVSIKALKAVELSYSQFANYDVEINNKSGKAIDVSVVDAQTKQKTQGFGLGPMGKVVVSIKEGQLLKLKNNSMKDISLTIDFVKREETEPRTKSNEAMINLTLHKSSMKSIPLIIPNVMNPNLSPFSNSGVLLKMGQNIYYKKGGNKKLLLTIDESFKQGDKVDVAQLIKNLEKDS